MQTKQNSKIHLKHVFACVAMALFVNGASSLLTGQSVSTGTPYGDYHDDEELACSGEACCYVCDIASGYCHEISWYSYSGQSLEDFCYNESMMLGHGGMFSYSRRECMEAAQCAEWRHLAEYCTTDPEAMMEQRCMDWYERVMSMMSGGVTCGNGMLEGAELCDDGNLINGDGCENNCAPTPSPDPICGNGVLEKDEECDDGNIANGDGCESNCKKTPPPPEPVCGNGKVEGTEQCDDGNTVNGDGCENTCKKTPPPPEPVCGNGKVEGTEQCDDGNTVNGDGCENTCKKTPLPPEPETGAASPPPPPSVDNPTPLPVCGNGILEPGETCDDGNAANGDGCEATCKKTPQPKPRPKPKQACGNGVREGSEECDDGNEVNGDGCEVYCKFTPKPPAKKPAEPKQAIPVLHTPAENRPAAPVAPNPPKVDYRSPEKPIALPQVIQTPVPTPTTKDIIKEVVESTTKQDGNSGILPKAQKKPAGCYRTDGTWTQQRSECSRTSTSKGALAAAAITDEQMRKALDKKFLLLKQQTTLLSALTALEDRIRAMQTGPDYGLNPEFYPANIAWIQARKQQLTQDSLTYDQLQQVGAEVKNYTAELIAIFSTLKKKGDINQVTVRMEQLLIKTYRVLLLMTEAGIPVDQEILTAYYQAYQAFTDSKDICIANSSNCSGVKSVLDILEPILTTLKNLVDSSGNNELIQAVYAEFDK